jgi:hypothetical protein
MQLQFGVALHDGPSALFIRLDRDSQPLRPSVGIAASAISLRGDTPQASATFLGVAGADKAPGHLAGSRIDQQAPAIGFMDDSDGRIMVFLLSVG